MQNLTWTCHVCGKERPDDKISVHSKTVTMNNVPITQNVRYCNDNPECIEGATKIDWIKP
jgi:hypothetical protein